MPFIRMILLNQQFFQLGMDRVKMVRGTYRQIGLREGRNGGRRMRHYGRICPHCGAFLDPEEHCDCEKEFKDLPAGQQEQKEERKRTDEK